MMIQVVVKGTLASPVLNVSLGSGTPVGQVTIMFHIFSGSPSLGRVLPSQLSVLSWQADSERPSSRP